jgi:hypothetical protein
MKPILLIDISTWKGHHEIYFKNILLVLLKNEFFVYAVCENNLELYQWTKEFNIQNCCILDYKLSLPSKILFKILSLLDRIILLTFKKLPYQFSSLSSLLFIKDLINKIGKDISVFFTDADTSLPVVPLWLAKLFLPKQWITLSIQPSYKSSTSWGKIKSRQRFLAENLFSLPSCKAVLSLHPIYVRFFKFRFQQEKFFCLPELIDITTNQNSELLNKIKSLSQGKKIISLTGALLPKRNLELLLEVCQKLNSHEYFVLIVGHLPEHCYSEKELETIKKLSLNLFKNSYIRLDYYIPNEKEFNDLLKISDIIYLQYRQHSFSSNILSKAIKLRKPVIISSGYIMEKVMKTYNWQVIVSENLNEIAETIINLTNNFDIDEDKYNQFLVDHAKEKFDLAISETLKFL